jgi:hypothetical protein
MPARFAETVPSAKNGANPPFVYGAAAQAWNRDTNAWEFSPRLGNGLIRS